MSKDESARKKVLEWKCGDENAGEEKSDDEKARGWKAKDESEKMKCPRMKCHAAASCRTKGCKLSIAKYRGVKSNEGFQNSEYLVLTLWHWWCLH